MARSEYHSKLNEWHLELAIAVSALERLLVLQDDDDTGSLG